MSKSKLSSSMINKTRTIKVENSIIKYTLKLDGVTDYLSFDETLLSILKLDRIKPFRDNGRLRLKVRANGVDVNMYLYDLAFACYTKQIRTDSFINDIQKYFEYKAFNNLSIDHADNNVSNNTRYNLSVMDCALNVSKGSIVSRTKIPTYLNTAYFDNKYRVQIVWKVTAAKVNEILGRFFQSNIVNESGFVSMYFICENAESFVDCLKSITTLSSEWALPLKQNGIWLKNDNVCWCKDVNNSIKAQEILVNMNETKFQLYRCTK